MATPVPEGIILETVLYNGPSKEKRNILFLGDGFDGTATDRKLFDKTIDEIIKRFFRTPPFNISGIKKMFNIFKAYTPSITSGISCNAPIDADGLTILDNWNSGPPIGLLNTKASALGLEYSGATPRAIVPKSGDEGLIPAFVKKLVFFGEADSAIPKCWEDSSGHVVDLVLGKDHGCVLVLVNDDKYGGTAGKDFAMISLGKENGFPNPVISATSIEHYPNSPRNDYNQITSRCLHELGHSFFKLKDEYSEVHTPVIPGIKNYYNENPNVVTKADISDVAGNIDPSLIKWNIEAFPGSQNKLISDSAFNYMQTNRKALFERPIGTICANVGIDVETRYPPKDVEKRVKYRHRIIGIYEGGAGEGCGVYSPAGCCKMKRSSIYKFEFCYVCKHAIIKKLKPALLEPLYKRFYPRP